MSGHLIEGLPPPVPYGAPVIAPNLDRSERFYAFRPNYTGVPALEKCHLWTQANPINYNSNYTVCFWINAETLSNADRLFTVTASRGGGYQDEVLIRFDDPNYILRCTVVGAASTSVNGTTALSADTWYHVAMIRSGTSAYKVYLDAVEEISNTQSISGRDTPLVMTVGGTVADWGSNPNKFASGFNGTIAHVKMWETDLSIAELERESMSLRPQKTDNLFAWYECATFGAIDLSGNNNHLTTGKDSN